MCHVQSESDVAELTFRLLPTKYEKVMVAAPNQSFSKVFTPPVEREPLGQSVALPDDENATHI